MASQKTGKDVVASAVGHMEVGVDNLIWCENHCERHDKLVRSETPSLIGKQCGSTM